MRLSFFYITVSISEEKEDSREYSLPYNWKKLARRRQQTSQENKTWDIYIITPCGKKLRSNPEIEKYLSENPDVQIDRDVTNTSKPSDLNLSRGKIEHGLPYKWKELLSILFRRSDHMRSNFGAKITPWEWRPQNLE